MTMAVSICLYYIAVVTFANPLSIPDKTFFYHFNLQLVQPKVIERKSIASPWLKFCYLSLLLQAIVTLMLLVIKILSSL